MESPLGQKGTRGCNRIGNITAIYGVVAVSFLIYLFKNTFVLQIPCLLAL